MSSWDRFQAFMWLSMNESKTSVKSTSGMDETVVLVWDRNPLQRNAEYRLICAKTFTQHTSLVSLLEK